MAAPVFHCQLPDLKSSVARPNFTTAKLRSPIDSGNGEKNTKIVLQPRLSTLRFYGSDRSGVIKTTTSTDGNITEQVSPFVDKLYDYIDTSRKSQDFEIISGRLAMIVFAVTVTTEILTGTSIFQKLDTQGIDEAAGAGLAAIGFAAVFAWVSIARQRVGGLFDLTRTAFIDSVVDQIVAGMFFSSDLSDEA